ncbi:hypothetical protein ACIQJT_39295 [Streptomyces sp. NPDC091972]|uniref:hypothetical protein n=1 Tax=Streptomyces sp. NPDC091972 TaxID=3366007 RepID=UPI00380C837E
MLKLSVWRSVVDSQQSGKFDAIERSIPSEYVRVLSSSREAMALALGLSSADGGARLPDRFGRASAIVKAEIYNFEGVIYVLSLRRRSGVWVTVDDEEALKEQAGIFFLHVLSSSRFKPDVSAFLQVVKEQSGAELREWEVRPKRFVELKQEGRQESLSITTEKSNAARLLSNKEPRILATAIKSAPGGLILSDVERQLKRGKVEDIDATLLELHEVGLIGSEYVVVCAKHQHEVSRFSDASVLEEMSKFGVRCGCGRKISDERLEEAVAITDLGRELLDKSTWMSIMLMEELRELGVPDDRIMIEYSSGGDEMDCVADINGQLILFELKDKEFSLREAYSFAAKIGLVRPHYPVIVTTEKVGGDARDHFEKAEIAGRRGQVGADPDDAKPIRFIEGLENLRSQLDDLASTVYRNEATKVLREIMPMGAVSPNHLLDGLAAGGR